ncbi:unnamed protein product [Rhodiola kirilowii]
MSGIVLKKGPWTSVEDAILIDHVKKHGEGNWNAVQKHSGLCRCGKSCRLRWANHLRPNLKKGPFTAEEERLIIELHAKMGNKWAQISAHLTGHTDNEIKNYWNTRIKWRKRAGLAFYTRGIGKTLETICSTQQNNFTSSQQLRHYCGSRSCVCGSDVIVKNELNSLEPVQDDPKVKYVGLFFPYDCDPGDNHWSPGETQDSHSFVIGNFSTPKPACEAVKSELPSFQYPDTDSSNWDTSYAASPLLDTFESNIQPVTPNETAHSDCSSPRNSGLLDALLYEARAISSDGIGLKFWETNITKNSEPISPLYSATSLYSGSGFYHPLKETYSGHELKCEPVCSVNNPSEEDIPARLDSFHPCMSSYSHWFEQESFFTMNQTPLEESCG